MEAVRTGCCGTPRAHVAVVELSETVTVAGTPTITPESLVFDLDGDGRIRPIAIYIRRQRPGGL